MFTYLILVGVPLALGLWASTFVRSKFLEFDKVKLASGITGAAAAAAVVRAGGGPDVRIERVRGFLSDHYDPRAKVLRLSPSVYDGKSVSAVAVAAHEAGHAIQDAKSYAGLEMRSGLVPITKFGSSVWFFLFLLGLIFHIPAMTWLGIALFISIILFQVVTLPVEFDASRRARAVLADTGIVSTAEEEAGVASVLNAAAMTYVAGLVSSIGQLIWLLILARR